MTFTTAADANGEHQVMLAEIALQSTFVRDSAEEVVERTRAALAEHAGRPLRSGVVLGCGDSYFAGLAARAYLTQMTGLWIEPVAALEFCGYLGASLPPDAFVAGVSNSGSVVRTIEGVRLARSRAAWTFAVTANANSELARRAETLVRLDAGPNIKARADGSTCVTPGTLTYTASVLGVYALALALGEHLERLNPAGLKAEVARLRGVADAMAEAHAAFAPLVHELAATFERERATVIIGGGPNLATAAFGAAKWYEALQWPAHAAETEEWAHQQYFFTSEATDTIVLLPPGGAYARGIEQLRAARAMGSRTIVIAERGDEAAQRAADVFVAMPPGIPEALTPLVYKLPFELLSVHIAMRQGIDFFGFANPLRQQVNFRQIFDAPPAPSR